jgi:nucleoside-diphosphate-sugar epimerase
MRIIVTGCNGRLGQAACEVLLGAGHLVAGIDAAPAPGPGGRPHPVIVENLLNPCALYRAADTLAGADCVVHLANHTNAAAAPPETVLRENNAMNTSVFMAAWQAGASRIVFASSIQAMLGGLEADGRVNQRLPASLPISADTPSAPTNVYGLSKVIAERMLDDLCAHDRFHRPAGPMSAASLRLPFIQSAQGFEMSVLRTTPTEFIWGGSECFAYIAREDAAEAVRCAVESPLAGHERLWCAAPDPRVPETVARLAERFYSGVPGVERCLRNDSFMDCEKAERVLGWRAARIVREERARRGLASVGPA